MKPIFKSLALACAVLSMLSTVSIAFALNQNNQSASLSEQLAKLEAEHDGQLGLYAIDTANNTHLQYRADERFPMQSTFKLIVASAMLKQSMKDSSLLQEKVYYKKEDLVFYSPITEKHLAEGMTIKELCAAAMMYSDNTATNLLIKKLGGLEAISVFAHSIGNKAFNLVNWEPEMNSAPANSDDTSTPIAMAKSLQQLALGNVLAQPQRELLQTWLINNTTGDLRIRAGVPKAWVVGDKTGASNHYGITNDIAVIWPPHCAPIVLSVYFKRNKEPASQAHHVIAAATRMTLSELAKTNKCYKLASAN